MNRGAPTADTFAITRGASSVLSRQQEAGTQLWGLNALLNPYPPTRPSGQPWSLKSPTTLKEVMPLSPRKLSAGYRWKLQKNDDSGI